MSETVEALGALLQERSWGQIVGASVLDDEL